MRGAGCNGFTVISLFRCANAWYENRALVITDFLFPPAQPLPTSDGYVFGWNIPQMWFFLTVLDCFTIWNLIIRYIEGGLLFLLQCLWLWAFLLFLSFPSVFIDQTNAGGGAPARWASCKSRDRRRKPQGKRATMCNLPSRARVSSLRRSCAYAFPKTNREIGRDYTKDYLYDNSYLQAMLNSGQSLSGAYWHYLSWSRGAEACVIPRQPISSCKISK